MTYMKKYIYSLSVVLILLSSACSHGEYMPEIPKVNLAIVNLDESSDVIIGDESFAGKFTVSLAYPESDLPDDARLIVIRNSNIGQIKTIKENCNSFPSDYVVSYQDLVALFGEPQIGDVYKVGMELKYGDTWYSAFDAQGNTAQSPDSSERFGIASCSFKKVVPYEATDFTGSCTVYDGFFDYEYTTSLVADNEKIIFKDFAEFGVDVVVNISLKDYTFTVDKTWLYGSIWGYSNLNFGPARGELDTTNKKLVFSSGSYTVDQGGWSFYGLSVTMD